jgi:hypothetical protein
MPRASDCWRGSPAFRRPRRIELLPYVATEFTQRSNVDPRNPFNDRFGGRAGADLKVGLGPNLSLDATINPDFGQVEADPAVVNLTAFEQVFEERRPFFVEGNELLTGRGQSFIGRPTWFYSRRVGAQPRGTAQGDFVDAPHNTTITTAAKVSGRLARGLSIGALAAVTPREFARTYHVDGDSIGRIAVEPPSRFGVLRLQQEFGSQQSNVGASFTTIDRSLDTRGALQSLLPRDAIAGGVDWKLRYKQGMYEVTGWLGGSRVSGDAAAIGRLQRNSAHFFQRPDQDYVTFDPTRTSLSGATASLRLDKNAGRFTLGGIQLSTRTPGFDINDAGQMRSGDDIDFNADIQLRDTKPNPYVRFYQFGTSAVAGWNYGGYRQYLRFNQTAQATLHSFLRLNARGTLYVPSLSDDLTRGGPLIGTPAGYSVLGQVTSRANMPTTWNARTEYYHDAFGGWRWDVSTGIATRPRPAVAGLRRPDLLALRRCPAIRGHAQWWKCRHLRPALRLCRRGAQHRLGALPRQLRPHPELHGGGLRRTLRRQRALLRIRRGAGPQEQRAARLRGQRDGDDAGTQRRRQRHRHRRGQFVRAAGARLPAPVVPLEPRAALGVAPREHRVPCLAAESIGAVARRRAGAPARPVGRGARRRRQLRRLQDQLLDRGEVGHGAIAPRNAPAR